MIFYNLTFRAFSIDQVLLKESRTFTEVEDFFKTISQIIIILDIYHDMTQIKP